MAAGNVVQGAESWLSDMASNPHHAAQAGIISRHDSLFSVLYRGGPAAAVAALGGRSGTALAPYPSAYLPSPYLYPYTAAAFSSPLSATAGQLTSGSTQAGTQPLSHASVTTSNGQRGGNSEPTYALTVSKAVTSSFPLPSSVSLSHHSPYSSYLSSELAKMAQPAGDVRSSPRPSASGLKRAAADGELLRPMASDESAKRHRRAPGSDRSAPPSPRPVQSAISPPLATAQPTLPHRAAHFCRGSVIQLADDRLKRVEDLTTDDFINSAGASENLKLDSSTVVRIAENADKGTAFLTFLVGESKVQIEVEALLEHPFFVFNRGWASASPERTMKHYHLTCQQLVAGDRCISLTHRDCSPTAPQSVPQQHIFAAGGSHARSLSKAEHGASPKLAPADAYSLG